MKSSNLKVGFNLNDWLTYQIFTIILLHQIADDKKNLVDV